MVAAGVYSISGEAHAEVPLGWDYDLGKKCARTPHPNLPNYFEEEEGCDTKGNWTLVVQAENKLGQSCVDENNQSYMINENNSPVRLLWKHMAKSKGWMVNMKIDTTEGLSCSDQFTFFGFFDHVEHGGGPLPGLRNLQSSHEVSYRSHTEQGGETRLIIGAQVFWHGKAHILEITPAREGYHPITKLPNGIIQRVVTDKMEYVQIDNTWGHSLVADGTVHKLTIDWSKIYSTIIDLGLFTSPGNNDTATQAIYVAVETHNKAVTDMWQSHFKVSSK